MPRLILSQHREWGVQGARNLGGQASPDRRCQPPEASWQLVPFRLEPTPEFTKDSEWRVMRGTKLPQVVAGMD